jgi:hypothetical protein
MNQNLQYRSQLSPRLSITSSIADYSQQGLGSLDTSQNSSQDLSVEGSPLLKSVWFNAAIERQNSADGLVNDYELEVTTNLSPIVTDGYREPELKEINTALTQLAQFMAGGKFKWVSKNDPLDLKVLLKALFNHLNEHDFPEHKIAKQNNFSSYSSFIGHNLAKTLHTGLLKCDQEKLTVANSLNQMLQMLSEPGVGIDINFLARELQSKIVAEFQHAAEQVQAKLQEFEPINDDPALGNEVEILAEQVAEKPDDEVIDVANLSLSEVEEAIIFDDKSVASDAEIIDVDSDTSFEIAANMWIKVELNYDKNQDKTPTCREVLTRYLAQPADSKLLKLEDELFIDEKELLHLHNINKSLQEFSSYKLPDAARRSNAKKYARQLLGKYYDDQASKFKDWLLSLPQRELAIPEEIKQLDVTQTLITLIDSNLATNNQKKEQWDLVSYIRQEFRTQLLQHHPLAPVIQLIKNDNENNQSTTSLAQEWKQLGRLATKLNNGKTPVNFFTGASKSTKILNVKTQPIK